MLFTDDLRQLESPSPTFSAASGDEFWKKTLKFNECKYCDATIAQFVENEIGNLKVASLSPALGTGKNWLPVHLAEKWIPGMCTKKVGIMVV